VKWKISLVKASSKAVLNVAPDDGKFHNRTSTCEGASLLSEALISKSPATEILETNDSFICKAL
jgi:hypothetical protein